MGAEATDLLPGLVSLSKLEFDYIFHHILFFDQAPEAIGPLVLVLDNSGCYPTIALYQSNLASVLQNLGEIEEAKDLLKEAYDTYLNKFGPEHLKTKTGKNNLESLNS